MGEGEAKAERLINMRPSYANGIPVALGIPVDDKTAHDIDSNEISLIR